MYQVTRSWRSIQKFSRLRPFSSAATHASRVPYSVIVGTSATVSLVAAGFAWQYRNVACEERVKFGGIWDNVEKDILAVLEDERYIEEPPGPIFVRLAWHSSGTYSVHTRTGGSSAAGMRFSPENEWGANNGLKKARDMLEPIKRKYPQISYSDLWIFAAVVAIKDMGGPQIAFRPGRKDVMDGRKPPPDGRLPNADSGCPHANAQHLRDIFGKMGFDDRDIVALSGAHGLGRVHIENSGYWGPWTYAPTTFSNEFFNVLLRESWQTKRMHEGKPWTGNMQFENKKGDLMMLPTDMVLIQDPKFKRYVELYANDEQQFFADFSRAFQKLTELGCDHI